MTIRELIVALEALPEDQKDHIATVRGYPDSDGHCDWVPLEELHLSEVLVQEFRLSGKESHWHRRVAPSIWLYA